MPSNFTFRVGIRPVGTHILSDCLLMDGYWRTHTQTSDFSGNFDFGVLKEFSLSSDSACFDFLRVANTSFTARLWPRFDKLINNPKNEPGSELGA